MKTARLPSQERLRALLDYDPETGVLTWRARPRLPRKYFGRPAGSPCVRGGVTYLVVEIDGSPRYAHRLVYKWMTGQEPPTHLDHKDGDGLNNRLDNLRATDGRGNNGNRRGRRSRVGKKKGVSQKPSGNFRAYINQGRRYVHLGTFKTEAEGNAAYRAAAIAYFGEFARSE